LPCAGQEQWNPSSVLVPHGPALCLASIGWRDAEPGLRGLLRWPQTGRSVRVTANRGPCRSSHRWALPPDKPPWPRRFSPDGLLMEARIAVQRWRCSSGGLSGGAVVVLASCGQNRAGPGGRDGCAGAAVASARSVALVLAGLTSAGLRLETGGPWAALWRRLSARAGAWRLSLLCVPCPGYRRPCSWWKGVVSGDSFFG